MTRMLNGIIIISQLRNSTKPSDGVTSAPKTDSNDVGENSTSQSPGTQEPPQGLHDKGEQEEGGGGGPISSAKMVGIKDSSSFEGDDESDGCDSNGEMDQSYDVSSNGQLVLSMSFKESGNFIFYFCFQI